MADKTGISWTDATWNPVRGCSRVSEGCRNCYAEKVAARFSLAGMPYEGLATLKRRVKVGERDYRKHVVTTDGRKIDDGLVTDAKWTGEVRLFPDKLADPLKWKRPRRIFVNSMSDLFHEKLTNEQIAAVFGVMAACPQHTFQILTKRAKRMREWFEWASEEGIANRDGWLDCTYLNHLTSRAGIIGDRWLRHCEETEDTTDRWPLPNCWLGVSVENQEAADERIPELLNTHAAVRFLSLEPLLGPVDLTSVRPRPLPINALTGAWAVPNQTPGYRQEPRIHWAIVGCESGPRARSCDVGWIRSLRDQCETAGVPYFLKQASPADGSLAFGEPRPAPIDIGPSAKWKQGSVIELPYLDGVQHAQFPVTT